MKDSHGAIRYLYHLAEHLLTKYLSDIGSLLIILTDQRLHDVAWSQAGNGITLTTNGPL